jgi:ATP-binding cassette, subfamily B (MDR/TAP), member 1
MSSTHGSVEKQTPSSSPPKKKGFFGRRPKPEPQGENEKQADVEVTAEDGKPKADDVQPVSFTALFRFSTRTELILDFVGLVCAAAAGAAQVRTLCLSIAAC